MARFWGGYQIDFKIIESEKCLKYQNNINAARRAFKTSEKFYGVHRNTIREACTRRLQLNIVEFRELVQKWLNGDSSGLKEIFKSHTLEYYHLEIDRFFA